MTDKPLRKRITKKSKEVLMPLDDKAAFSQNKSSPKAKKTIETNVSILFELWHDKHYHDRHSFGDENGKRTGIEPSLVESLIKRSIPFLIYYSSTVKGFKFINYDGCIDSSRILLQEELEENTLNVVIESHCIGLSKFEITIKTAMSISDFRISDNQYVVKVDDSGSVLYLFKSATKSLQEINSFSS